tara:strand:+ start:14183 stop:14833 length:651 start_codon:yes stop_codon:yes gene_type:complete
MKPTTVLFDLDGTLLNSGIDVAHALNIYVERQGFPAQPYEKVEPLIPLGSGGMLKLAMNLDKDDSDFEKHRQGFFDVYERHFLDHTQLYPGVMDMLDTLDEKNIKWGIVTNKITRLTKPVLRQLNLLDRVGVLVCADTLAHKKPHPEPILHACKTLGSKPAETFFVGDGIYDLRSSQNAGTKFLVALYGYTPTDEDASEWPAVGYLNSASEVLDFL